MLTRPPATDQHCGVEVIRHATQLPFLEQLRGRDLGTRQHVLAGAVEPKLGHAHSRDERGHWIQVSWSLSLSRRSLPPLAPSPRFTSL